MHKALRADQSKGVQVSLKKGPIPRYQGHTQTQMAILAGIISSNPPLLIRWRMRAILIATTVLLQVLGKMTPHLHGSSVATVYISR